MNKQPYTPAQATQQLIDRLTEKSTRAVQRDYLDLPFEETDATRAMDRLREARKLTREELNRPATI